MFNNIFFAFEIVGTLPTINGAEAKPKKCLLSL